MTDAEVICTLKEYFASLFPKTCSKCGRTFATLREYILSTTPLWPPVVYDLELDEARSGDPIGGFAMANCACGTTLTVSTKQMPVEQSQLFLQWIRTETVRRGIPPSAFLDRLRDEIRRQVLAGDPV